MATPRTHTSNFPLQTWQAGEAGDHCGQPKGRDTRQRSQFLLAVCPLGTSQTQQVSPYNEPIVPSPSIVILIHSNSRIKIRLLTKCYTRETTSIDQSKGGFGS